MDPWMDGDMTHSNVGMISPRPHPVTGEEDDDATDRIVGWRSRERIGAETTFKDLFNLIRITARFKNTFGTESFSGWKDMEGRILCKWTNSFVFQSNTRSVRSTAPVTNCDAGPSGRKKKVQDIEASMILQEDGWAERNMAVIRTHGYEDQTSE